MRAMIDEAMAKRSAAARGKSLRIEILGFSDCPNTPLLRDSVAQAVALTKVQATVIYVDEDTLSVKDARRRWPAPTVLVDGRDLFGMPAPQGGGMGCRMYQGGIPSVDEVSGALRGIATATPDARVVRYTPGSDRPPIVCTLAPEQLQSARDGLIPGLFSRADKVEDVENGLRMSFTTQPGLLADLAHMMEQERGCCRFLRFQLTAEPAAGAIVLDITGPPGTREVLRAL
jgi:hypothetical protein